MDTNFAQIGTTTQSTYTDTGLASLTTYYYRVCAFNLYGTSSYSNIASATTGYSLLYIFPSYIVIGSGSTSTVNVMIDNVLNLVGSSIYLSFDPSVEEGTTRGTLRYDLGLLTGVANGSGTILSLKFSGKENGCSSIALENTQLMDDSGRFIEFETHCSTITIGNETAFVNIEPPDLQYL